MLTIVAVILFVGTFGLGLGPIPWLITSEILPAEALPRGGAAATVVNWGSNFIVALSFGPISNALGKFSFVPNAVVLVAFVLFCRINMPETKGKTLEQIQAEMLGESYEAVRSPKGTLDEPILSK